MRSIRLEYHGILLHIILLLMILRELYINITISIFHKYQVYCTLIKRREPFFFREASNCKNFKCDSTEWPDLLQSYQYLLKAFTGFIYI